MSLPATHIKSLILLAFALFLAATEVKAQIKAGANLTSQHPSAIVEIESSTQGFLLPRMSTAQRLAIASPANGLMVYSTVDSCVWVFRNSLWRSQCDPENAQAWGIFGNSNIIDGTHFLGTTTNVPLTFRVNGLQILKFNTNFSIQRDGGGNARGSYATDFQASRSVATQAATGTSATIGGGSNNTASGLRSTIAGGFGNQALGDYSVVSGGSQDTASANYSGILAGYDNNTAGIGSVIGGGYGHRIASGAYSSAILSGQQNYVSGNRSAILGGYLNTSSGFMSSVLGGYGLKVGTSSTGFSAYTADPNRADVSAFSNTAYFGDVDLWIGNVNNSARELRFYEPNTSLTFSGTNYTSFKAGAQAVNLGYILPLLAPTASDKIMTSDASGNMSWASPASLGAWLTLGNASTVDGTNFLGTTDNIALNFRVNNQKAGRIGISTEQNAFFGYQAGNATTGIENAFFGHRAGNATTTGVSNSAFGANSLLLNTTGIDNTAIGNVALYNNSTGASNTAIGKQSLLNNLAGSNNSAVGLGALRSNTSGWSNSAFGYRAAFSTTTGLKNVALGDSAMYANSTGGGNTFVGFGSGLLNTTGANNTLVGNGANVSGAAFSNATAIGYNALAGASNSLILGSGANVGIGTSTPNSTLQIVGSVSTAFRRVAANVTLDATDHIVLVNCTAATRSVTLPAASTCAGREYVVGKSDETTNALTFLTAIRLTETTSISSLSYAKKYKIVSDGTDWWIFSE